MPALLPTALFANYDLLDAAEAAPSQGVFIPLASLPGLTAAEAAANGDGRKVSFEIIKRIQEVYTALATGDRPSRMTATAGTPTGVSASVVRRTYTLTFDVDVSAADVASEP